MIKRNCLLYKTSSPALLLLMTFLLLTNLSHGQDKKLPADSITPAKKSYPDGTTGLVLEVGPDDYLRKTKKPPNEFEGTYSTIRIGLGYIAEGAAYSQNAVFKKQMDSAGLVFDNKIETRDARIMASGVFKTERTFSWKFGMMYDGDKRSGCYGKPGSPLECLSCLDIFFLVARKRGIRW